MVFRTNSSVFVIWVAVVPGPIGGRLPITPIRYRLALGECVARGAITPRAMMCFMMMMYAAVVINLGEMPMFSAPARVVHAVVG
jgi:hypothetical protein